MGRYKEIDLAGLKKYSITSRPSKVHLEDFADPLKQNLAELLESFPDLLAAKNMKELVDRCVRAFQKGKPIVIALGGHVVKCGLSPYLIDLMEIGLITTMASNGSVVIHDFEIAKFGKTSEDVATALEDGSFGFARETGDGINNIITDAYHNKLGFGEAIGKHLSETETPNKSMSLLAKAYEKQIPFTVHVALGTDIVHQHETANGAAIGDCSMRDFRIFCNSIININEGGVFLSFGSAVVMPEVFLKAVTVVRNLGYPLRNFYTAVFDMNLHYRPKTNIVERPTKSGGKGYYFVGHHEIVIPLFYHALKDKLQNA
jgi:deoxyhypusine synthase